jgi:hypothetical protein
MTEWIEHSFGVCDDCKTVIYLGQGRKVIAQTVCPSCKQLVEMNPILHFKESLPDP